MQDEQSEGNNGYKRESKWWIRNLDGKDADQSVPARILACSKKFTGIRFLREKLVYHNYQHGRKQRE
ncbi:hypothetical protein EB796_012800 [Bugula neritina]|uniref:Uncharacterized protein n=1 Tax=Bugula neritina TaxID=10212 RepID=A0A7J7JRA6_BUGNE|nr:hypothetical protein EB796_012800 [Bugula neritina]